MDEREPFAAATTTRGRQHERLDSQVTAHARVQSYVLLDSHSELIDEDIPSGLGAGLARPLRVGEHSSDGYGCSGRR